MNAINGAKTGVDMEVSIDKGGSTNQAAAATGVTIQ